MTFLYSKIHDQPHDQRLGYNIQVEAKVIHQSHILLQRCFLSVGVFSWGSSFIIKYYLFSEVVQYTVQSIILFITPLLRSLPFRS